MNKERVLITANLHGHLNEFKALLEEVNYNPATDQLVTLGNYLNYGNKQIELIDYLMELQSQGAVILCGLYEEKYIDSLINSDFQAEQFVTKSKNVFYNYLDNNALRNKHLKFLISLKNHYTLDNMFFSSDEERVLKHNNYYCINDIECTDDIVEEDNLLGVRFFKNNVGLVDITNRTVYKISIK